jgi:hypothetical protein
MLAKESGCSRRVGPESSSDVAVPTRCNAEETEDSRDAVHAAVWGQVRRIVLRRSLVKNAQNRWRALAQSKSNALV